MEKVAVTIIGAGVVGLAVANELSKKYSPIYVIEKEDNYGTGISSRNSEVVHAGIYYPPNSLKASLCIEGNVLLTEYCKHHEVPFINIGKYIVAADSDDLPNLDKYYANALECGVKGLIQKSQKEINQVEPEIKNSGGIYSPNTSVLNVHDLMDVFHTQGQAKGVEYSFKTSVKSIYKDSDGYIICVQDSDGDAFEFKSEIVINSAGLNSDTVAEMVGINIDKAGYRLHYWKGDYFIVQGPQRKLVSHLIYPVPPAELKGLGVHITIDVAGNMHLGPDTEYIGREKVYYDVSESKRENFWQAVNRYFPGLDKQSIQPERSGIRPKLQAPGDDVKDFVIKEESARGLPGFVNLIGIESPGLTASLAIAKYVQKLLS